MDRNAAGCCATREEGESPGWGRLLLLRDSARQAMEAGSRLKCTLCQTHSVFLSICLPLTLGQVGEGRTRTLLLLSALFSAASLPAGLAALGLAAGRVRRLAERNDRDIRHWEGTVNVLEPPGFFEILLEVALFLATAMAFLCILCCIALALGWVS
jgi:hypothetical protein